MIQFVFFVWSIPFKLLKVSYCFVCLVHGCLTRLGADVEELLWAFIWPQCFYHIFVILQLQYIAVQVIKLLWKVLSPCKSN